MHRCWWLLLLLIPSAGAQIVPGFTPATGYVFVSAPPVLQPQPNETLPFYVEIDGSIECSMEPGPADMDLAIFNGQSYGWEIPGRKWMAYSIEPAEVTFSWRDMGDGRYALRENLTFRLSSEGAPLQDIETHVAWNFVLRSGDDDRCTPSGYVLEKFVEQSALFMPAQAAAPEAPAPKAAAPANGALAVLACLALAFTVSRARRQ